MRLAIVASLSGLLSACAAAHEPQQWSVEGCSEEQVEAVRAGAEWWNADSRAFFGVTAIKLNPSAALRHLVCVTDDSSPEAAQLNELNFVGWAIGYQIFLLDTPNSPRGDTLVTLAAHEFGHHLGLGHLPAATDTMYYVIHNVDGLSAADRVAFHTTATPLGE